MLRDEIEVNYIDAYGLVSPHPCAKTDHASNNGVMYASEYYAILALSRKLALQDCEDFETKMSACLVKPGLLKRSPDNTRDQEAPDDYYGYLAGCHFTGNTHLALDVLHHGWANFGSFDNVNPGKFSFKTMLWRQPQLMAMTYAAADKRVPVLLAIIAAAVIATSCSKRPPSDTDGRRLSWLLLSVMREKSWLCKQASKIWMKRLYKDYNGRGMKAVAELYYGKDHPFSKYWVD